MELLQRRLDAEHRELVGEKVKLEAIKARQEVLLRDLSKNRYSIYKQSPASRDRMRVSKSSRMLETLPSSTSEPAFLRTTNFRAGEHKASQQATSIQSTRVTSALTQQKASKGFHYFRNQNFP